MKALHRHILAVTIFLLLVILLYPPNAHSAFKCMVDGQVEYSDHPCGEVVQLKGESQNSYSGSLRTGERDMLNRINRLPPTAAGQGSSDTEETEYSKQLKARKQKVEGISDRPKRHSQNYKNRGSNRWR